MTRTITIPGSITVGALAEKLELPVAKIIGELMKNGMMMTVNERLDADTANIIIADLGLDVELLAAEEEVPLVVKKEREHFDDDQPRPPVVAVMGHVDHGKTSLLDRIRSANTAAKEAGGITQHISAYQVKHGERAITFLDTPGHSAFAALREHGAHLTDVAIIVVAADDGVKPQTIEAIRFARKANAKIIVAINKVDKEGADINRVKQELAEQELLIEEWGGDTVVVEVSAKTGQGVDQLLDMVLLVADVEELTASPSAPAAGLVIESHMEMGRGAVAIALVQQGTIHQGDFIIAGKSYAKIRILETPDGSTIKSAGPSTPVQIAGFKSLPEFGNEFIIAKDERTAREAASKAQDETSETQSMTSTEMLRIMTRRSTLTEFNVVIKADVQGSLTSVVDSLQSLNTEEVAVRVVGHGVGNISENDIRMAEASKAVIYGFQVNLPSGVKQLSARSKVPVRLYRVIYELIDDVRQELSDRLAPEVIDIEMGRLIIRAIFRTSKDEVICGGEVTKGKLVVPAFARHLRDGKLLETVEVTALKRGPQETKEVEEGEMCGMSFKPESKPDVLEGDHFEFFTREIKQRNL